MKQHRLLVYLFYCVLVCFFSLQAKVLVVVDNGYYQASKAKVDRYVSEVASIDKTPTELLVWTWSEDLTSVRNNCYPLWSALQQKYVAYRHVPATSSDLEGAVFIGKLPIPMFKHIQNITWNIVTLKYDTVFVNYPHDYYYMDLWNSTTGTAYPIDTTVWHFHTGYKSFYSLSDESNDYKSANGDAKLDIWVTRVMAENIQHLRDGTVELTQYQILDKYLDRVHARMTAPATVPERSFSMSGITEWSYNLDDVLNLDRLHLPFHARFQHPQNNPANLISQLQSGPLGNTNYGAYYGSRYAAERNTRNCVYSSLFNVATGTYETVLDTFGYEWVGLYEHGNPIGIGMNGVHHVGDNSFVGLNGSFDSYNITPMINAARLLTDANGYLNKYYYFGNDAFPTSPWGWLWMWRGRDAYWKAQLSTKGDYDVYIYYVANSVNAEKIQVRIDQNPVNNIGKPLNLDTIRISQRVHSTPETPGSNWEKLGKFTFSSSYDTAVIKLLTNGNASGRFVIDAVKFVGVSGTATQNITVIVDDQSPSFTFSDWYSRWFMDMQEEDLTSHKKYSKTPFYLANSCHLNEYSTVTGAAGNCMGMLFAMAHNGLISMGTVNSNYSGQDYIQYIDALNSGKSFGAAFLEQANNRGFFLQNYILIGAGTLRAKAYVTYGSALVNGLNITGSQNLTYQTPLHLTNATVSSTGNTTISAKKEIRIMPETVFRAGAYVRLVATN